MVSKGSAAWIVAIVAILGFFVGALVFTVTDPVMQAVFDSQLWTADTTEGKDALGWQAAMWAFVPVAILLLLLVEVWIGTRQPT